MSWLGVLVLVLIGLSLACLFSRYLWEDYQYLLRLLELEEQDKKDDLKSNKSQEERSKNV